MAATRPAPARWWPVELVAPKPAAIPWARAAESAVAIGGAFGLGVLSGHTVAGLLASLGALPTSLADRGGAWRVRGDRMVGSGLATGAGLIIGAGVRGGGWLIVVVVAACAAVAGLVSALNPVGSLFGLNLLVYVAISASDPLPGPAWRTALIALAGAAWALVVKVPWHVSRPVTPEREAVAAAYDAAADLLEGAAGPDRYDRRWALTAALNQAEDALVAARSRLGGPDPESVRLLLSLEHANGLNRAAVARLARRQAASPTSVAAVRSLAALVRAGGAVAPEAPTGDPAPPDDPDLVEPWAAARRAVAGQQGPHERRLPGSTPRRWAELVQRVGAPRSIHATARLVVCIVAAELCCVYLVHRHPYWVPLTVAVAMKPDFGSVFARAVQRALGTAIGVVIGGTIMVVISDVRELLPFFVVLAALLPITVLRNYGMFVTCLTPLVLIQIDALTPTPGQLVTARLLDTLLGVGIVLVLGYGIWPSTWRPRLLADARSALDAVVADLRATAAAAQPESVSRRASYRALSNVRTTFSQHFADPSPTGRQARILWPMIVALERILDETVHLAADPDPPGDLAEQLRAAADTLHGLEDDRVTPAGVLERHRGDGPTALLWDGVGEAVSAVEHLRDTATAPGERVFSRLVRGRRPGRRRSSGWLRAPGR